MFLAVLVTTGRPVFFRQQRPGRHGRPFELVKFRTMHTGEGSDADRITRVGSFLRSSSLDELPELWNVVRGDMSLVGPRPLLMEYLPLYSPRQATRHRVRPGITGLAQVNGRNLCQWDERLELDARYVENLSLGNDLRILSKTVSQVLRREGISAEGEATMHRFTGPTSPMIDLTDPPSQPVGRSVNDPADVAS
jgi:lipopolysaccharide/colanic/teichoic acid biosynthesis glycosyltransferase